MRKALGAVLALSMALPPTTLAQAPKAAADAALRIVVIAGEDAVNIIRQRTAVAPIVEVRDRNDLPVAGALVTFAIDGGRTAAFSAGAKTLTVTTNAAGQATADGLVPLARGVVKINVRAAFQGQVASTTIVQTNAVAAATGGTGAAAGAGTGAAGGTAAAGATVAASSGGISATTLAIIGGAVGAGALVATQVVGKDGGGDGGGAPSYSPGVVSGPFSGEFTFVFGPDASGRSCARVERESGTLRMDVAIVNGVVQSGAFASINDGRTVVVSSACSGGPQAGQTNTFGMPDTPVTGTSTSLTFRQQLRGTAVDNGLSSTVTTTYAFSGAESGGTIVGTFTKQVRIENTVVAPVDSTTMTMPVTLTRTR